MAKTKVSDWDTTAANNTDVGNVGIAGSNSIRLGNDAIQEVMAQIAKVNGGTDAVSDTWAFADPSDTTKRVRLDAGNVTAGQTRVLKSPDRDIEISGVPRGHIYGLKLSNNSTDATNDIDIAAGEAASTETNPVLIVLASALTKRLDAAWTVGTGNGGLDTGSIADTTYHVFLIQRSDTGVVDALFSTSVGSPNMPTNYDRKRRIGSILRESGAIVAFQQIEDEFIRSSSKADVSANAPGTGTVDRTLSVPAGIRVAAKINATLRNDSTGTAAYLYLGETDKAGVVPSSINTDVPGAQQASNYVRFSGTARTITTDTSRQIRTVVGGLGDSSVTLYITTHGWFDSRGRLG